jgi:hypothetical protein
MRTVGGRRFRISASRFVHWFRTVTIQIFQRACFDKKIFQIFHTLHTSYFYIFEQQPLRQTDNCLFCAATRVNRVQLVSVKSLRHFLGFFLLSDEKYVYLYFCLCTHYKNWIYVCCIMYRLAIISLALLVAPYWCD